MHEMTLLSSVMQIVQEEMGNSGLARLTRVTLKSGALAGREVYVESIEGDDDASEGLNAEATPLTPAKSARAE